MKKIILFIMLKVVEFCTFIYFPYVLGKYLFNNFPAYYYHMCREVSTVDFWGVGFASTLLVAFAFVVIIAGVELNVKLVNFILKK